MSDRTSRSLEAQAALADGLFPHQVEGVAFLLGRRRATKEMRGVVDWMRGGSSASHTRATSLSTAFVIEEMTFP